MKFLKMLKYLGLRRYLLHLAAKALRLHAKIENGQPIGINKKHSPFNESNDADDSSN